MSTIIFNLRPCLPSHKPTFTTSTLSSSPTTLRVRATFQDSKPPNTTQQQQLNLSVLRFTLGIPGLDESYLPRWIGYGFGSLLFLNHFLGTDSATMTPAQLTTEVLGLSLASFSVALPYLGKFLKGAQPVDQATLPDGTQQIFVMSQDIADGLKEDLAWASYVLLRNSNAIAALIFIQRDICARGYWNIPDGSSKEILLDWFAKKIEKPERLTDVSDSEFPELVSKGTSSLLVQPVLVNNQSAANLRKPVGFILLASAARYAFSTKDRAWIAAVANKLGEYTVTNLPMQNQTFCYEGSAGRTKLCK
ncbi:protein COFACTOR ASSEMBLY OF COMPLEX C SUBUNIT B CCB2, chloroplastic [Arachis duranensis]|uniref:Protein COFACTOR ASSEMBLY OF COMPLEX C SUBUNIT B CCB2, chloroplastic n=1 Tax=Arachis duranensis TaxID=130453 RepID=A0A9C6TYG1_ARADU|nr:protein COFACTOR ASSEMBLY OF COMPLEX C SUBUNIT B CCB2, chloroplastic [Arachis duranensis]